nr:GBS Bsp-like repeat-containing protein [Streptococcus dysgalactiae]
MSDGKTVGVAGSTYSEIWKDVNIGSPSGTITIQNNNSTTGTFDVIISNVYNPGGVKGVKVPIWSTQNGQDDIIWYDATLQSNGTYKVSVSASNHQNNTGEYNVPLYYVQNDGSLRGIAVTTVTVQKKTSSIKATVNGSTYTFTDTVEVRNEANTSSAVVFYFNKGDSVNNASLITSNGHQWVTYTSYSGVKRYVLVD